MNGSLNNYFIGSFLVIQKYCLFLKLILSEVCQLFVLCVWCFRLLQFISTDLKVILANSYFFKVTKGNTRKRCERCSKLTIKTPELRHWRRPGVFIDFTPFSSVSIVHFERINLSWDTDVHYTFYTKETLAYPKYWKHSKFAPGFARSNLIITLS